MPVLLIDCLIRSTEVRIGERANPDCDMIGFALWLPEDCRAAIGTEMEDDGKT